MKLYTKILFILLFVAIILIVLGTYLYHGNLSNHINLKEITDTRFNTNKLHIKSVQAKQFAEEHKFSTQYCFLINMEEPSGKNRFYVYDLNGDSVATFGLVAHGCGSESFANTATFSNKPNSNCTALGKYKVGGWYKGRFGDAWKLIGLDSSNNNSFDRNIVLHAYDCVPDIATYPLPICNSRGCPMVSYTFLKILKGFIKEADQPVLLWIYNQ